MQAPSGGWELTGHRLPGVRSEAADLQGCPLNKALSTVQVEVPEAQVPSLARFARILAVCCNKSARPRRPREASSGVLWVTD